MVVALVVAALAPATALGQAVFVGVPDSRTISELQSAVTPTGNVTITFHGDAAAGCEAAHVCGVTGTETWKPRGEGVLLAFAVDDHGTPVESGFLELGNDEGIGAPMSFARVRRADAPDELCSDAGPNVVDASEDPRPGSSVRVDLTGSSGSIFGLADPFRTHCAGPAAGDVASLLPKRLIGERALRHGPTRLDFSADGSFAAHGFAGTLHSNLALRVEKADQENGGANDLLPPGIHTHVVRTRFLEVDYRVESVSGQAVASVRGLDDPDLCGPLDACGLTGTVSIAPQASTGEAFLLAYGPARHSVRELRRALGLAPGPRPAGVHAIGSINWIADGGSATSDLTRAGVPACNDSAALAGGFVPLRFTGDGRIRGDYAGEDGGDPLRTRCPGPGTADVVGSGGLVWGAVPTAAVRAQRLTMSLDRGHRFSADGYAGSTSGDITVVARRTRVHGHVQTDREPIFP